MTQPIKITIHSTNMAFLQDMLREAKKARIDTDERAKKDDDLRKRYNDTHFGYAKQQRRGKEDVFAYHFDHENMFRFFAVFDGHGSPDGLSPKHAAVKSAKFLHKFLFRDLVFQTLAYDKDPEHVCTVLRESCICFDKALYKSNECLHGTTCTAILVDDRNDMVYTINIGDSRTILFDESSIVFETRDHVYADQVEKDRAHAAGAFVLNGRVNSTLNVARTFGDFDTYGVKCVRDVYDPVFAPVSAVPDVSFVKIKRPMHAILTSDGTFESRGFTSQSLVELFRECADLTPTEAATVMLQEIREGPSTDDLTVAVVCL